VIAASQLTINQKTAKALRYEIPRYLLALTNTQVPTGLHRIAVHDTAQYQTE
jgi:hypothetical protein